MGTPAGHYFEVCAAVLEDKLSHYGPMLNFVAAFYITFVNTRLLLLQIFLIDFILDGTCLLKKSHGRTIFVILFLPS